MVWGMSKTKVRTPEDVAQRLYASLERVLDELIATTEHTPEVQEAAVEAALNFAAGLSVDLEGMTEGAFLEKARRALMMKRIAEEVLDQMATSGERPS